MMAVQIFEAADRALPGLEQQIATGDFKPLREWLRREIHERGSLYPSADELLTLATGRPLDPQVFLRYLTNKYAELYHV